MSLYTLYTTRIEDPIFERTTWPVPGPELDDLEWWLRYADPRYLADPHVDARRRLAAASVIAAYKALVLMPRVHRERYAGAIKRVARKRKETEE